MFAVVKAMALMEATTSRRVVIAAPTGGAAGVLPAALLAVAEDLAVDDQAIVHALFTAGGIGMAIDQLVAMSGSVQVVKRNVVELLVWMRVLWLNWLEEMLKLWGMQLQSL